MRMVVSSISTCERDNVVLATISTMGAQDGLGLDHQDNEMPSAPLTNLFTGRYGGNSTRCFEGWMGLY